MTFTNLTISRTAIGNQIGQLEKKRHQDNSETIGSGLKFKIQLLAEFCHPLSDMKFADPRGKSESIVFQTNDTKELKTQGTECQGPAIV